MAQYNISDRVLGANLRLRNLPSKEKALITGLIGQDGSNLAELLLSKNYIAHGIRRGHRLQTTLVELTVYYLMLIP